ncbi:hypothetical protein RB595_001677 [Gaeumannomyces hyphopodioides]
MWANLVERQDQLEILKLAGGIDASLKARSDNALLNKLSDISFENEHAALGSARLMGSAMWFPDHDNFRSWFGAETPTTLWIHGSPGTGKSTLVCLAIDTILGDRHPERSEPVAFFYVVVKNQQLRSASDCARSLLRQLLQHEISSNLPREVGSLEGARLSGKACLEWISKLIDSRTYKSVTFVIDALDKLAPADSTGSLSNWQLLEELIKLAREHKNKCPVKILLSTQAGEDRVTSLFNSNKGVEPESGGSTAMELSGFSTDTDSPDNIKGFVQARVDSWNSAEFLPGENGPDAMEMRRDGKAKVVKLVTEHAGRVYLWAEMTLVRIRGNEAFRKMDDLKGFLDKLELLPSGVDKTYEDIWKRRCLSVRDGFVSQSQCNARTVLQLLHCAKRRLATQAVLEALRRSSRGSSGNSYTAKDIIYAGGGLIAEDPEDGVLEFFHPSVRQFLDKVETDYGAQAHTTMARICLSALSKPEHDDKRGRSQERSQDREGASAAETKRRSRSRSNSKHRGRSGTRARQKKTASEASVDDSGLGGFEEYAAIYWATHASRSGDKSLLKDVGTFLKTSTSSWMHKAQTLLSQRPHGFYGAVVEQELRHCMSSHAQSWWLVAVVYNLDTVIHHEFTETEISYPETPMVLREADLVNDDGLSALHLAAKFGHSLLFDLLARSRPTPKEFLEPDKYGTTAMEYKLQHLTRAPRKSNFQSWLNLKADDGVRLRVGQMLRGAWAYIEGTSDRLTFIRNCGLVAAALRNQFCPRGLLGLLRTVKILPFKTLPQMVPFVGEVLDDANESNGEADGETTPTPSVGRSEATCGRAYWRLLKAAFQYADCSAGLLDDLGMRNSRVTITRDLLVAAAGLRSDRQASWDRRQLVWEYIAPKSQPNLLTDEVLAAAVVAGDAGLARYLRQVSTPPLKVTSWVLESAVAHKSCALDLVDGLLEEPAEECTSITASMLKDMAGNREQGAELLKTLRECLPQAREDLREPGPIITQAFKTLNLPFLKELVKIKYPESCSSWSREATQAMAESLNQSCHDPGVACGTFDLSASDRDKQCAQAITLVVEHFGRHLPAESASSPQRILPLEGSHLGSHQGPEVMKVLFGLDPPASDDYHSAIGDLLKAAARNETYGCDLLKFASDASGLEVGALLKMHRDFIPVVIQKGSWQLFDCIRRQGALKNLTPEELRRSAENPDVRVARFIFGRYVPKVVVEDLIEAAGNSDAVLHCLMGVPSASRERPLQLLVAIAKGCKRTATLQQALNEADRNRESKLLKRVLVKAAIQNKHGIDMLVFVLIEFRPVTVTKSMLEVAAANPVWAPEMLRVLLSRCRDERVGRLITKEVIEAAEKNKGSEAGSEAYRFLREERKASEALKRDAAPRRFPRGK